MFTRESDFISACARFGLVLDANMLAVYIVGHISPEKIQNYDVTEGYDEDDYRMIKYYVEKSRDKTIVTTSYIISEVVHLLGAEVNRQKKGRPFKKPETFDKAIDVLSFSTEFTKTNVREMLNRHGRDALLRFGIPDISLVEAVDGNAAFLSSDSALCDMMAGKGLPALHYSRARVYYKDLNLGKILGRLN